jgi:hypothetical protein
MASDFFMPATTPTSAACPCGQVVFDLSERKRGEVLNCSWCGKKFRYAGGEQIVSISAEEAKRIGVAGPAVKVRPRAKKADGPPGGVLPMIGFIVAFNALAFVAVWILLPKGDDELRHAIWDPEFTVSAKALWPDLCALGLGHIMGFAAWALYVYRLHRRERMEKKA